VHGAVGPQWAKDGSGIVATNAIDGGMKVRPNATELAAMGPEARKVWADVFENAPDKPMMFGGTSLVLSFSPLTSDLTKDTSQVSSLLSWETTPSCPEESTSRLEPS
jgi:hypothetical protein